MIVGFIYMKMISCRSKIIVFLLFFYINTVAGTSTAETSAASENVINVGQMFQVLVMME